MEIFWNCVIDVDRFVEFIRFIRIPTWTCFLVFTVALSQIKEMAPHVRLIIIVLFLNVFSDLFGNYLASAYGENGWMYNSVSTIEKVITLWIFKLNSTSAKAKRMHLFGIYIILMMSAGGYAFYKFDELHLSTYIASGLVVGLMSYLHVRHMVVEKADFSPVMFGFSIANFAYYTIVVSSLSASAATYALDPDLGDKFFLGIDIAYTLWSLTILTALLWKKRIR